MRAGRDALPGARRLGLGVAGGRARAAPVRRGRRSLFGRTAPRHRRRRPERDERWFRGHGGRLLRGAPAAPGALSHGPDRGRVLGHARPSRLDRSHDGHGGLRGRRRGDDRPERRRGGHGAVRLPRHQADGRSERVPRPADSASTAACAGAASGRTASGSRRVTGSPAHAGEAAALGAFARDEPLVRSWAEPGG
jgi:hypothetical protein